jgi:hypothetical protein
MINLINQWEMLEKLWKILRVPLVHNKYCLLLL